jgi:hypothetical protein
VETDASTSLWDSLLMNGVERGYYHFRKQKLKKLKNGNEKWAHE